MQAGYAGKKFLKSAEKQVAKKSEKRFAEEELKLVYLQPLFEAEKVLYKDAGGDQRILKKDLEIKK